MATQRNLIIVAAVAAIAYYLWTTNKAKSDMNDFKKFFPIENFSSCGMHKNEERFVPEEIPLVTGNYLTSEKHQQSFDQNTSVTLGSLQTTDVPIPNIDYGKVTNVDTKGGIPVSLNTKYLVDIQGKTDVTVDRKLVENTPFGVSPHVLNATAN